MMLIRQPSGTSLCGQACVAMAAGVSLNESIVAIHGRAELSEREIIRGTHTHEVVAGLRKLGVRCASRLRRTRHAAGVPVLPPRAIVAIVQQLPDGGKGRWHWMYWHSGRMLDPDDCWPDFYRTWKITSYLAIDE